MSLATLAKQDGAVFRMAGDLQAAAVPALLKALPTPSASEVAVDLAGLEAVDSAGLGLLVEWRVRQAAAGGRLRVIEPPERLVRLARISGVDRLLGMNDNESGMTEQ